MEYSRSFNHDALSGDSLRRLSGTPIAEVCKTGFEKNDLIEWLNESTNATLHYVAIRTTTRISDNKKIFAMAGYNSAGKPLTTNPLMGDLPCPDQCVPPEFMGAPSDNTFSKSDLQSVIDFIGLTYLNVHSSLRIVNGSLQETHSIYPVTGIIGSAISHAGPNDPAFTSVLYQP